MTRIEMSVLFDELAYAWGVSVRFSIETEGRIKASVPDGGVRGGFVFGAILSCLGD